MLVLFDVDKTLFMTSDPLMGQATTEAIEKVWERRLAHDAIRYVDHPGQTAMRITRLLLWADGLSDDEIERGLEEWCRQASGRYLELLSQTDTSEWRAAEEAAEAIARIEHRALLTGNPEPVARARMEIIGLDHLCPEARAPSGARPRTAPS